MKTLLLFLIFFSIVSLHAETYYVKSSGNDSNTGLTDAQAWVSLTKVNGFAFSSGDSVLFRGGDVWISPGALAPYRLSPSVGNIYIGSYGTGQAEFNAWIELAGWEVSENWEEYSTNVWRMVLVSVYPNRLWLNGKDSYRCSTLSLTSTENWRWVSNYLYVYATENPSTFYNSIRSGNTQARTIGLGYPGITLDNVKIVGGNNAVSISASNVTVKNCTIGDKINLNGINVACNTPGDSVDNVLIYNNKLMTGDSITYDYIKDPHSTGDAIQLGEGSTNCKVYNNYFEKWSHCALYMLALDEDYPFNGNEGYSNYITSPTIDYARAFGVDYHISGYDNSIHDNVVYNMSIGNQLNGNTFKFYNNVIDGIRDCSYSNTTEIGIGFAAYASAATNMEVYNNTVVNCYAPAHWVNDYGYGTYGNYVHDNNFWNSAYAGTNYQLYFYTLAGVNNNIYTNNHIYSSNTANTVYYNNSAMTVSAWNDFTTINGDSIAGNDTTIDYTQTPSTNFIATCKDLHFYYNYNQSTSKTVEITTPQIDENDVIYNIGSTLTLEPMTNKVLSSYYSNYTVIMRNGKYHKSRDGKIIVN